MECPHKQLKQELTIAVLTPKKCVFHAFPFLRGLGEKILKLILLESLLLFSLSCL